MIYFLRSIVKAKTDNRKRRRKGVSNLTETMGISWLHPSIPLKIGFSVDNDSKITKSSLVYMQLYDCNRNI